MPNLAPTTPQRCTSAIQCLTQIDRDLSLKTRTALISIFQNDLAAADTYIALGVEDAELRHAWMQSTLVEHHPGSYFPDLEGEAM